MQIRRGMSVFTFSFILVVLILIYKAHKQTLLPIPFWRGLSFNMLPITRKSLNQTRCTGYGKNNSQQPQKSCLKRFPNYIIIGVQKGGSLALLEFLSDHPQIVRNESYNECQFFTKHYHKGLKWYKDQMPYSLPGQIVIEKSPGYFETINVPRRVFSMNPNIKLILTVREPVERAISHYAMHKRMYEKKNKTFSPFPSFESVWVKFIRSYDIWFENWLKLFKLDQIHIVDGDKLSKYPVPELKKIEAFLDIDPYFSDSVFVLNETKGFYCLKRETTSHMKCLHEGKGRKHPNVSPKVIHQMRQILLNHNEHFFELIGRRFEWNDWTKLRDTVSRNTMSIRIMYLYMFTYVIYIYITH